MKFLWQRSEIQIVSIFAHNYTLARQERLYPYMCLYVSKCVFVFEKNELFAFTL